MDISKEQLYKEIEEKEIKLAEAGLEGLDATEMVFLDHYKENFREKLNSLDHDLFFDTVSEDRDEITYKRVYEYFRFITTGILYFLVLTVIFLAYDSTEQSFFDLMSLAILSPLLALSGYITMVLMLTVIVVGYTILEYLLNLVSIDIRSYREDISDRIRFRITKYNYLTRFGFTGGSVLFRIFVILLKQSRHFIVAIPAFFIMILLELSFYPFRFALLKYDQLLWLSLFFFALFAALFFWKIYDPNIEKQPAYLVLKEHRLNSQFSFYEKYDLSTSKEMWVEFYNYFETVYSHFKSYYPLKIPNLMTSVAHFHIEYYLSESEELQFVNFNNNPMTLLSSLIVDDNFEQSINVLKEFIEYNKEGNEHFELDKNFDFVVQPRGVQETVNQVLTNIGPIFTGLVAVLGFILGNWERIVTLVSQ